MPRHSALLALLPSLMLTTFTCVSAKPTLAADSRIEVVLNTPIETDLSVAGVKATAVVWCKMIDSATTTIDLEQFYIYSKAGEALQPVLEALRTAAARGVHVRILVDSQFYTRYRGEPGKLNQLANVQVRTIDFSSRGGIQHAKYFVVDGKDAFVGSANFDWVALTHVHEVGLHITDTPSARRLERIFAYDWANAQPLPTDQASSPSPSPEKAPDGVTTSEAKGADSSDPMVVASPPDAVPPNVSDTMKTLVKLTDAASSTVRIQVYEFSTKTKDPSAPFAMDTAIRRAAARGAHVMLLVDQTALKKGKTDLQKLAALPNIQVRVVSIPDWSGGHVPYGRLVHSKYCVIDGKIAWVGSENFSDSYFTACRNVGAITSDTEAVLSLTSIFDKLWNSPYASAIEAQTPALPSVH